MNVLDLFSGIGGFSLGLERAGMRIVAFCEIEHHLQLILRRRWPNVPIYGDVRNLSAQHLTADRIGINVIAGGFPCQDISIAGGNAGIYGERSGLWSEYARLIDELRPSYAIVENVAMLLSRGLGKVLGDLAALRYDAEWHCVPSAYVGARHIRDRVWIIAYPHGNRQQGPAYFGDCLAQSLGAYHRSAPIGDNGQIDWEGWASEPAFLGKDDDVPGWAYRVDALGNAVVPKIPEIIGRAIMRHAQ